VDDDVVWRDDVFHTLVSQLRTNGLGLVTTRGWSRYSVSKNEAGEDIFKNVLVPANKIGATTEVLVPSSGWCTLLNTKYVNPLLFDGDLQVKYGLRFSDEIFLSAMVSARKYVIPLKGQFYAQLGTEVHQWRQLNTSRAKLRQLQLIKRTYSNKLENSWQKQKS
jgi:hypothetical protein